LTALQGAAFGVMPSLYEPFGMANEFYLNGAVGIGRATGGLLQQIVPLRAVPSFTPDVNRRSSSWHSPPTAATGLLYREADSNPQVEDDWKAFNAAKYLSKPGKDRVAERKTYQLFVDMAGALEQALTDAIQVCHQPLAPNGVQPYHIQRGFSWEWSAAEYNSYLM
jgi:glycogen synthase